MLNMSAVKLLDVLHGGMVCGCRLPGGELPNPRVVVSGMRQGCLGLVENSMGAAA
jgi:hypothetical protein